MDRLKVFITTDVEIWPEGWGALGAADLRLALDRYIHGRTRGGDYGLPFQLRLMREHGLSGVYFVESLFTHGFGLAPLREIVGLIQEAGQEIQLHLHPEWIDKFKTPILPRMKGYYMHQYTVAEQTQLLQIGLERLREAGVGQVTAFRAGSYGAGPGTLEALEQVELPYDTSHNGANLDSTCRLDQPDPLTQPVRIGRVWEIPITCFRENSGRIRPLQIHACSLAEMTRTLAHARRQAWYSAVIVLHGSELLGESKRKADPIAIRRFEGLCRFLAEHPNDYETCGFNGLAPAPTGEMPPRPTLPLHLGLARRAEQAARLLWS